MNSTDRLDALWFRALPVIRGQHVRTVLPVCLATSDDTGCSQIKSSFGGEDYCKQGVVAAIRRGSGLFYRKTNSAVKDKCNSSRWATWSGRRALTGKSGQCNCKISHLNIYWTATSSLKPSDIHYTHLKKNCSDKSYEILVIFSNLHPQVKNLDSSKDFVKVTESIR